LQVDEAYQLLLTFGFILILTTRSRSFGGVFKIPPIYEFLDGAWPASAVLPVYNAFVIAVGLVAAVVLWAPSNVVGKDHARPPPTAKWRAPWHQRPARFSPECCRRRNARGTRSAIGTGAGGPGIGSKR
jgi:hypothetical protein